MEVDIRHYLKEAKKEQDSGALQSAYHLLEKSNAAGTSGRIPRVSPDLYVVCAEAALQLGCLEISTACLKMFFEGNPPANQFLCRAYLCQGQLKSPPATGTVEDFEEAVLSFLKAIEMAKSEPGSNFIVFNASVLYFHTVRPLLQPGRCHHLVPSLRQVVWSLNEIADQDYSWRAELMMHLVDCLIGSGKTEDAASFAKITEEFINSNSPHLYPRLFTLQARHNLTESDVLIERSQQCSTLTIIYKIQDFKNRLEGENKDKPTGEELKEIFHLLEKTSVDSSSPQTPTPIQPADRVAFLLELALLALQLKHQKVAADCLKELKSAEEASNSQRIIMECVNCEIDVLKREAKMDDCSKASVEARLKEIGKLDQWLQTAVREGDPRAMQAVCATQWSLCLPLLQHNLRKRIKKPLLRVSQVLEDMQSMLLEMRCQVHSELAVIEEEDGRLEAALTHFQKASLLDNGAQRERLSSALHLLQLRGNLHQAPPRKEDKAALLLEQAKDVQPQDKTDVRPILVAVGLLLAPDDFQMVLDADDTSKIPVGSPGSGSGPAAELSAKAQHHSASVQTVDGHLARQLDEADNTERLKLWATLVKRARKWEVWDVCRAACRFCLLYDDSRWKISQTDKCGCAEEESCAECHHGGVRSDQTDVRDMLRLLAEIHFVNAEATVHKLRTEGMQLNSPPVPGEVDGEVFVSEKDPHWVVYRDWIQALSAHTTSSFLRAAELGAEIKETWVVTNAAVYLWNHSSHLLAAGEYRRLLPTFQTLVEMLRGTECTRSRVLFTLLCDAVARGWIQPLCGLGSVEPAPPAEKSNKKRGEKGKEKAFGAEGGYADPAALQEVHKASELCDYALRLSNGNNPGEIVPIAVRKQVVSTWVQIKRLLQQQIGSNIDTRDECENEEVLAMTRVLVGVEMLQCNRNPRHMEFSVPSLSTLVSMASESSWTDAVVELQVWCQLASFCHGAEDHSSVLRCTERALQLGEAAEKSLKTLPCVLYGQTAVNEMLSSAACLRGLSLTHESKGNLDACEEVLSVLLSGVSFAEKAQNAALCAAAAKHYWNVCLPLTQTAVERQKLQEPLEKILAALVQTNITHGKVQGSVTFAALTPKYEAADEEDLTLRAAIYRVLLHIQTDKADWKRALQLLDQAIRDIPTHRHQLPLLKQRILVKVRLGESVVLDMKKLRVEGEQCCSFMWHQAALCSDSITQQLSCYQKSISSLTSAEARWQKVDLLLEFGEWLYCHNFPKADAQQHVQWAVDILLQRESEHGAEDESKKEDLSSVRCNNPVTVQSPVCTQSVSDLKEVLRLDSLVRAHTLLADMADRTTPEHQLSLLRAYTFVLQIWKVSMAVCCEISSEMAKTQQTQPPPSAGSKKGKDKSESKKVKDPPPAEDGPKPVILNPEPPSTPSDWACFICPDQARQIFRTNKNPHCISTHSIRKQTQSLFYLSLLAKELKLLSLDHLTLPIMHLSETIAHDLLEKRSLSDLYRLRIVQVCRRLDLEAHSPYHEQLLDLSRIPEQEQMDCRREISFPQERRGLYKEYNQSNKWSGEALPGQSLIRRCGTVCSQDMWLDKAEVCLSMGLFQQARQLLAEAHLLALEVGDLRAKARSLLCLADLACEEQNFALALNQLEEAKDLGGDEEFWYQFTLTKVRAVVGQRDPNTHKVKQIIEHGCDALKLILEQRVKRVQELTFLITSLKMRGAVECVRALGGQPGETLCKEAVQRITAACSTLRECVTAFTDLGYRQHTAEAHLESARCLGILGLHTSSTEDVQRLLLDSFFELQRAVTEQEHVVLNAQRLVPSQEESPRLSLAALRKLQRLRLDLTEFSLVLLEEQCEEEKNRALAREKKTPAEIILEDFIRSSPEPGSIEKEWSSVGSTVGQVALSQLTAVRSQDPHGVEARARCLSLIGKYLRLQAVQEDPLYLCSLWDRHKQTGAWSDLVAVSVEEENSEEERHRESARGELRMTHAKSAELQQRRCRAQQLLAEASNALTEAISLCLQHKLPYPILAEASIQMLECHGQSDPAVAGQHLALFQSCCTVATMAGVLSSACSGTSESQFSALLSLHEKLLLSQEEKPGSMLKGVEDSLNSLSKAFSHLTINPNHLNILAELPPNLKILLLQHSEDGSQLYGALYEMTETPNQKAKTTQCTGTLTCSRVAKVSVCPRALLALRDQIQAFGLETGLAFFKEACRQTLHATEGRIQVSEEDQIFPCENTADEVLTPHIRDIVQDMEDYLKPLLNEFDFSGFRPRAASLPAPETTKTKDKEEKESAVKSAEEPGQYVVLLADSVLLQLPLEALTILREDSLTSVSRDFSLQVFHSRLTGAEPQKVESDNKKETKGGKGTKAKADQSHAIKVGPRNRVLPSHTFPVDTRNFKYIVDPHNEGSFDGTSLSTRMEEILETHSQQFTSQWEGFMGSKQTPSLLEMQQLLSRCSAFIYLGMERFMANIPPEKRAGLSLSECRLALLFDLIQNKASEARLTNLDVLKSSGQLALEKPLQTALLLSLGGVGCITLNQWHSNPQQNVHSVVHLLDNLLRVKLTSGQALHSLRKENSSEKPSHRVTGSHDADVHHRATLTPSAFNCILYGLPNLMLM